jgi:hypothetical protein
MKNINKFYVKENNNIYDIRGIQGAFVNLIDRDPVHDIAAEVKAMNLRDAAEEAKASRKSSLKSANEEKGKEEWSNG